MTNRNELRWAAVVGRDASADGTFYYSVETTGVYCRPSCGARLPLRDNVQFHATREEAERAGFRPCKRCKPDGPSGAQHRAEVIAAACRRIESADEEFSLERLAADAGLSVYHFHRLFRLITGLTPKRFAAAHRAERMRAEISKNSSVTDAIYAAGYNASSRFYARSAEALGMKPASFRDGGKSEVVTFASGHSSLGVVLVAKSARGICAISLGDDLDKLIVDLRRQFPNAQIASADADFARLVADVIDLLEGSSTAELPLDIRGTAFQRRVWAALQTIPAGSTMTYSELAEAIGAPKSVRAVANACAANALAVAIPCHRVVRNDGTLSGYRWGVERKKALLSREREARA